MLHKMLTKLRATTDDRIVLVSNYTQARSLVITPCKGGCGPKGSLDHLLPAFHHPPPTYLLPGTSPPLTLHPPTYCSLHTYLLATYYSRGL